MGDSTPAVCMTQLKQVWPDPVGSDCYKCQTARVILHSGSVHNSISVVWNPPKKIWYQKNSIRIKRKANLLQLMRKGSLYRD